MGRRDARMRLACPKSGKTLFGSEKTATEALHNAWDKAQRVGQHKTPTRVYHCPHCGWWHLTSGYTRSDVNRRAA
jgi:hypothetical protein